MRDTLIDSLRLPGKMLMQYFSKPLTHNVKESQSSIVTEADLASDEAVKKIITSRFPSHNIVSEETGFSNNGSEYTWVVDPLDGTSNFSAGIPWFGVLVTLMKQNDPVLAGAYLPYFDIIYIAEKGKGATRNGNLLPFMEDKPLKDSLFAFSIDYTDDIDFLNKATDFYRRIVKSSRNVRATNCLIDFIYVAEGRFGGLLNLYTKIWDIAGLSLLIHETGGVMKNVDGNELQFKLSGNIAEVNYPVLAGNRSVVRTVEQEITLSQP